MIFETFLEDGGVRPQAGALKARSFNVMYY